MPDRAIDREWREFEHQVVPAGAGRAQRESLHLAFVSGALAGLHLLMADGYRSASLPRLLMRLQLIYPEVLAAVRDEQARLERRMQNDFGQHHS
jgi:hypothetical protein